MNKNQTRINGKRTIRTQTKSFDETQSPNRWYLLFAGSDHAPRGGLGDLLQTFGSHDTALDAFRKLRLMDSSPRSWAQLAVVDGVNGIQPLCWFGIGATPNRSSTLTLHPEGAGIQRRARIARQRTNRF